MSSAIVISERKIKENIRKLKENACLKEPALPMAVIGRF